ncbi:DUF2786 domain-containing protein [Limnobaculum xujianqingii]|uniref:DUF2786 domain-containing protein n=1 Tax=Limnobaculum xujianqingii TaxID=2738837 RepID=UPI00112E40E2|nr:DUF2786 domain-containing protein [Limnobaculum xujianqingii]
MKDKEKYLAKIKKLLNLANRSSNANEAANALSQAQKMMNQHGVTSTDVELSEIAESASKGAPSDAATMPRYMSLLFGMICRAFGVDGYWSYRISGKYGIPKRIAKFIGVNERPQIAAYAFDVLSRQIKRARKEFLTTQNKRIKTSTKTARADQFCEGWISGAYKAVTPFIIPDDEKNLMAVYMDKLTEEHNLKEGKTRGAKDCRGSDDARFSGYLAGRDVKLHAAVNGATNTTVLLGDSL